jgi:hypothetical protein
MHLRAAFGYVLIAVVFGETAFVAKASTQKQVTNTSSEPIHIERALLAFCDDLREKDQATREEFSQFTAGLRKRLGDKFDPTRVPSVVQWFPSRQQFIAGGSLSSSDSTYLLLLPIGTMDDSSDSVAAVIAWDFHVVYTARYAEKSVPPRLLSNTLTITFRGFREITAAP